MRPMLWAHTPMSRDLSRDPNFDRLNFQYNAYRENYNQFMTFIMKILKLNKR